MLKTIEELIEGNWKLDRGKPLVGNEHFNNFLLGPTKQHFPVQSKDIFNLIRAYSAGPKPIKLTILKVKYTADDTINCFESFFLCILLFYTEYYLYIDSHISWNFYNWIDILEAPLIQKYLPHKLLRKEDYI